MTQQATCRAYFDYAATAPLDTRLWEVMTAASWANANSLHAEGREARKQLEDARKRIAKTLGARQPAEIIFTSGGTESDNMAVKGLLPVNAKLSDYHVIVSNIEHHAVSDAAASLKKLGCHVHEVACGKDGIVTPAKLRETIENALAAGGKLGLVSVMAVNNELGTIQPVRELAEVAHDFGGKFVCDGVQALGKLDINLEKSGVDAAAFSGHKIGAPKGVGILYLRRTAKIQPLVHGGGQENGLRSGTSNVMGAVALARAIELSVEEREANWNHAEQLRSQVLEALPGIDVTRAIVPTLADDSKCVPHTLSFIVDGLEGETVVQRLDLLGVATSSGSACSTGSLDPSHVIMAVGVPKQRAYGSLRLSFGAGTTQEDVDLLLAALPQALR